MTTSVATANLMAAYDTRYELGEMATADPPTAGTGERT